MFYSLHILASLVNTAVVQSGGLLNAFKKQAKDPKNELEFLKVACETSALHTDCNKMSVKEKDTIIRSMEASKLWRSVMKSKYVAGPLPEDGILFKEDIHTAFKRGNVQTNFKLIITTASYEGIVHVLAYVFRQVHLISYIVDLDIA